jgi:hypothetical protein
MPINKQEELEKEINTLIDRMKKSNLSSGRTTLDGEILLDLCPDDEDEASYITLNEWLFNFISDKILEAKQIGIEEERKRMAQKLLDMETVQEILDYCDEIIYPESYKKD